MCGDITKGNKAILLTYTQTVDFHKRTEPVIGIEAGIEELNHDPNYSNAQSIEGS